MRPITLYYPCLIVKIAKGDWILSSFVFTAGQLASQQGYDCQSTVLSDEPERLKWLQFASFVESETFLTSDHVCTIPLDEAMPIKRNNAVTPRLQYFSRLTDGGSYCLYGSRPMAK